MIDVEGLLAPVSAEDPCGPSLEYDKGYLALDRIARGKPEQRQGDAVIPAEEPDWVQVQQGATDLLGRTKDLRVALLLAKALLRTGGFTGFSSGLQLVRGLVERYWDGVHPRLDPDDNNDPAARMNILGELADPEGIVRWVRISPLVDARGVGKFSLRDVAMASGELQTVPGAPDKALIEAAFSGAATEHVVATGTAVRDLRANVNGLLNCVNEHVGVGNGPELARLRELLDQADRVLKDHAPQSVDDGASHTNGVDGSAGAGGAAGVGGGRGQSLTGDIRTRDDVLKALDKILAYYERNEPSSPVPVLLKRSRRLATMGFMDIMRDIAPSGLTEVQVLRGKDEEGK